MGARLASSATTHSSSTRSTSTNIACAASELPAKHSSSTRNSAKGISRSAGRWRRRGTWTGAEAAFRTADRLNVPSAAMGSYAFLQLSAGKFGAVARDIFEEARAAEPQNELYYRFLAFVHEGLGEWERANELYESGMSLFGSDHPRSIRHAQSKNALAGRAQRARESARDRIADPFNAAMLASVDRPGNARAELRRAYDASVAGNPNRRRDIGLWAGHFGDPRSRSKRCVRQSTSRAARRVPLAATARAHAPAAGVQSVHA